MCGTKFAVPLNIQLIFYICLQDHIADRLDQSVFPYVKDAPHSARNSAASTVSTGAPASLRSSRPQWAERAKTRTVKEPKQRLIVFQLGGMTYSEIRSVYQVSNASNRDVFIGELPHSSERGIPSSDACRTGSSHVLTPKDFLQELAALDKGGAASMSSSLAPDSARYDKYREMNKGDKTARMTPQEGFDRRFPFVSTKPSVERQPSQSSSSQQQAIPSPVHQSGRQQQQSHHAGHQPHPQGVPSPISTHRPQPSESRSNFSQKLLHPTSATKATPPSLKHAQSYDSNFNPVSASSPSGSKAPSIASANDRPEKEKKKKNLLKKIF